MYTAIGVLVISPGVVVHEGLDESEGVLDGSGLGDLGFVVSWYLTLGIDSTVACIHGNTAQMQRGNDNVYVYAAKTGPTSTPTSRVPLPST